MPWQSITPLERRASAAVRPLAFYFFGRARFAEAAVHLGFSLFRHDLRGRGLHAILRSARDDAVFVGHQRFETLARYFVRIVLLLRVDLGILHAGANEEIRIGWAGHQRRDFEAGIFEFVAQRLGER